MSAITSAGRSERRRKARKKPLSLVYVELAGGNGGMMRDLSEEGFAVRAMMPLRAGEKTPFNFSLNESVRLEGHGQILWVEEDGRVAGVQFTDISPAAREQIRKWLISGEVLASREKPADTVSSRNPTLEQLREEMYSVPPRPDGANRMPGPVETAPIQPGPIETTRAQELEAAAITPYSTNDVEAADERNGEAEAAVAARPVEESESMHVEETEPSTAGFTDLDSSAPPLPRISWTPKVVDPVCRQEPSSASPAEEPAAQQQQQDWKPNPVEATERTGSAPESQPRMPDISAILMQPPSRTHHTPRVPAYMEGLPSLETAPAAHDPWSEKRFSLSGIFTFMSILALAAAVYVFHRNVGQGLIWLGEAMGGVEQRQTQSPTETPPRGPAKVSPAPATNMPTETPSVRPDSAAAQGAPTGNANQDENATAGKGSSVPAVSPPSGVSPVPGATASTSPSAEVGQSEYVRAMQLLGGRNGQVDMPEALRLLWIAVEKGNANAELELAEMYWRGRGVIQNCDQALILLTAATRKGSAEAQRRLQEFQKQGCE